MRKKMWTAIRYTTMLVVLLVAIGQPLFADTQEAWTVKEGDTLADIIWTLKAQGVDVKRLREWNPELGTRIRVGEKIIYFESDGPALQLTGKDVEQAVKEALAEFERSNQRVVTGQSDRGWSSVKLVAISLGATTLFALIVTVTVLTVARIVPPPPVVVIPNRNAERASSRGSLLVDPTKDELRMALEKSGGNPVPFVLTLTREEKPVLVSCEALLGPHGSVVVRFASDGDGVRWDTRRQVASNLLARGVIRSLAHDTTNT